MAEFVLIDSSNIILPGVDPWRSVKMLESTSDVSAIIPASGRWSEGYLIEASMARQKTVVVSNHCTRER